MAFCIEQHRQALNKKKKFRIYWGTKWGEESKVILADSRHKAEQEAEYMWSADNPPDYSVEAIEND